MTALPCTSVRVRTWFGDDSAWDSLVLDVETPTEDGFLADVFPVNDPAFKGMSAEALKVKQPSDMDWEDSTRSIGEDGIFRGF